MALILTISVTALCLAATAMAFMRRQPAAAVAFAAMCVAGFGTPQAAGQYWFWGVATVIVTVNLYLGQQPPLRALRMYTAGGALAGTATGAAIGSTAALIVSGAIGALLGFEAFRRTPGGRMNASPARRLSIFADTAIPALITFLIVAITLASTFLTPTL